MTTIDETHYTISPRPPARQPGVSFICHRATEGTFLAHHRNCDGRSYTHDITDKGVPCTCTCHTPPAVRP